MKTIVRETRETRVEAGIARGSGSASVATGVPFLDHMLVTLARCSGLDLSVSARGDLAHHLIEDVAITVGKALTGLVSGSEARYASRLVPMDDALVQAAVDIGGRPYYAGRLPAALYEHWMRSFAHEARITLHLRVLRGRDRHHVIEAAFKALGLALCDALADGGGAMSTKGSVTWEGPC